VIGVSVPKLRFPEFSGEWEEKRLADIGRFFSGGTPLTTQKEFYNGNIPFIKSGEIDKDKTEQLISEKGLNNSSAKIVRKGDILFALYGATSGEVAIAKINGAINQAVLNIQTNANNIFLYNYFLKEKPKITRTYLQGGQGNLSAKIVKSLNFPFPSILEQEKIASFLSKVDSKIDLLKKKQELWETYKKGIMQQIFSQKLRFKDENGEDYLEWEEKKLGEVASDCMYGMNAAARDFDGENKYIRITDISENTHKFDPNPLCSPNGDLDDKFLLKENDIVFARTGASTGKSYLYDKNDEKLYFAGFLIKFNINKANSKFVFYNTIQEDYANWVNVMSVRSGQPGINAEEYKKLTIRFPSIPEQTKIAEFLSLIDIKIEKLNKELGINKEFKKGLLQQMFC